MRLSLAARAAFAALAVAGLVAYAVIVDLGVNAGRVHRGVSVDGVDVGGLSEVEAARLLATRAERIRSGPGVEFALEGRTFTYRIRAADVGWTPAPTETAAAAMAVGRSGGLVRALWDRARATVGGIELTWGATDGRLVTGVLDELAAALDARGVTLDRGRMRYKIRRAFVTGSTRTWRIPVTGS
ncbi:MAG TPA: hypothetical protein VHJ34_08670 [Actinomycetota bacterium]|nr:hypothetical protein [Actinomycetota bacterium]